MHAFTPGMSWAAAAVAGARQARRPAVLHGAAYPPDLWSGNPSSRRSKRARSAAGRTADLPGQRFCRSCCTNTGDDDRTCAEVIRCGLAAAVGGSSGGDGGGKAVALAGP